jgi:hypothetical protein
MRNKTKKNISKKVYKEMESMGKGGEKMRLEQNQRREELLML